jgi:hypothetical protein
VLGLVFITSSAFAQGDAQQPASDAPPTVETTIEGDVPMDLRGVWLITSNGEFKNSGKFRNGLDIETIRQKDGKLEVEPVLREFPSDVQTEFDESNKQWKKWAPSPEQIDAIQKSLDQLKPVDPMTYFKHINKIMGPSKDGTGEVPADSKFVLDVEHVYRPHPADEKNIQLMTDKATYIAKDTSPTKISGDMNRSILAASFVPVPLNMTGTFTMYRLRAPEQLPASESAPAGGLRGFFAGLFRGCR